MLGALDLLVALGRDDLRVVRCRCGSVWQDYPLFTLSHLSWLSKTSQEI